MTSLSVKSFIHPHTSPVRTASDLAEATATQVKAGHSVEISFVGVRGITTSFFNMFFVTLYRDVSKLVVEQKVTYQFDNPRQMETFQRSWSAAQ